MACIIFDYDGVLVDSRNSWIRAFKLTSKEFGFDYDPNFIESKFGPKTIDVIRALVDGDEEQVQKAKDCIDRLLREEETVILSSPNPDVNAVVSALKEQGHYTAILTNGDRAFMEASSEKFGFDLSLIDRTIAAEDPFETKEDAIADLIIESGQSAENTYYIGDRVPDIEVSKNAGCKSVIFLSGYGWESDEVIEQAKPDHIIRNLKEIPKLLKKV